MCVWVRPYLVSAITVKINEHEGMVKCMKFFDRISETLGLYEEEDDELLEEEEPVKKAETAGQHFPPSLPLWEKAKPEVKCRLRKNPSSAKRTSKIRLKVKPFPCRLLKSRSR